MQVYVKSMVQKIVHVSALDSNDSATMLTRILGRRGAGEEGERRHLPAFAKRLKADAKIPIWLALWLVPFSRLSLHLGH